MRTKSIARWAMLAALLAAPRAFADDPKKTGEKPMAGMEKQAKLADSDIQLLAHFKDVDRIEVEAGRIAEKQATTRAIKSYARQLVADHRANDRQLDAFAKKHGVVIPKPTAMTESEQKEMKEAQDAVDRLRGMKGADFDREFLLQMVTDHDKEVANIDSEASKAQNPALSSLIKDMKPVLQRHADSARDLQKAIGQAMPSSEGKAPASTEKTPPTPPSKQY